MTHPKVLEAVNVARSRGSLNANVVLPIEEAGQALRHDTLPPGVSVNYTQSIVLPDGRWGVACDLLVSDEPEAPPTERSPQP